MQLTNMRGRLGFTLLEVIDTDICSHCYCLFTIAETEKCKECGTSICPLCDKCECNSQRTGLLRDEWPNRVKKNRPASLSVASQKPRKIRNKEMRFP